MKINSARMKRISATISRSCTVMAWYYPFPPETIRYLRTSVVAHPAGVIHTSRMAGKPDPRPRKRIKADRRTWEEELRPALELQGILGTTGLSTLESSPARDEAFGFGSSTHHLVPKGQGGDDVLENLLLLTGSGTTAMHGRVTANEGLSLARVRAHLERHHPEKLEYIIGRKGVGWLDRRYPWNGKQES